MSQSPFEIAIDRLAKARKTASDAQLEIQELEQFLSTYQKLTSNKPDPIPHRPLSQVGASQTSMVPDTQRIIRAYRKATDLGKSKTQSTLDAIEEILRGASRPISPRDIYDQLIAAGISVSGRKPLNNVSAMLSNARPRFDNSSGNGWVLPRSSSGTWFGGQQGEPEFKNGALQ